MVMIRSVSDGVKRGFRNQSCCCLPALEPTVDSNLNQVYEPRNTRNEKSPFRVFKSKITRKLFAFV